MAQIETIGGGVSYTQDGKKLTKKVYILTPGTTTVPVESGLGSIISADVREDVAGTKRVEVTYQYGGGGSVSSGGIVEELTGGSREVPVKSHEYFKDLTRTELAEIDRAAADIQNQTLDTSKINPARSDIANTLLDLLQRGVEYYLVPSVNYRETVFETTKPTIANLTRINAPVGAPKVNTDWNWLLTSINYQTIQRPDGNIVYQVTREWTLSGRYGWQANNTQKFKLYRE